MPTFTIVGGGNGAGKSSLSGVLKVCLGDVGVVVDPDQLTARTAKRFYRICARMGANAW